MSERIEFKPPQGVVPEDVTAGDTFDLVTTYRVKSNGEICLVQMGDVKMPGYEKDEYDSKPDEHREAYGSVMDSMHSAMGSPETGAGY